MKKRTPRFSCLLFASMLSAPLYAQEILPDNQELSGRSHLRGEMNLLIRADAQQNRSSPNREDPAESREADSVVLLDPLIVTEAKKLPDLAVPRENRVRKLLRTGTIRQHIGKRTTVRLWSSGDAGIVLSFRR
jgi:hypothetical protein